MASRFFEFLISFNTVHKMNEVPCSWRLNYFKERRPRSINSCQFGGKNRGGKTALAKSSNKLDKAAIGCSKDAPVGS